MRGLDFGHVNDLGIVVGLGLVVSKIIMSMKAQKYLRPQSMAAYRYYGKAKKRPKIIGKGHIRYWGKSGKRRVSTQQELFSLCMRIGDHDTDVTS